MKDVDSVEYAFADINCSLGLRLKNGRFRFFNSSKELNMALAEVSLCLSFRFLFIYLFIFLMLRTSGVCFRVFTGLPPLIFSQL